MGAEACDCFYLPPALLHNSARKRGGSFSGYFLTDSLCEWDSERCEAVEYGHADVNLCDLTLKIRCCQAQPQKLDTVHFRFDAASSMISLPPSLHGPP